MMAAGAQPWVLMTLVGALSLAATLQAAPCSDPSLPSDWLTSCEAGDLFFASAKDLEGSLLYPEGM